MSPRRMHDFIRRNHFHQLDLNLFPTPQTRRAFARDWHRLMGWMRDYLELWFADRESERYYELGFALNLSPHMIYTGALDMTGLRDYLAAHLRQQIYIDHGGDLYFVLGGGLCTVTPLTWRFGYRPVGNVAREGPGPVLDRLDDSARQMAVRLSRDYLKDPRCARCPHFKACMASGAHGFRRLFGDQAVATADCPIGIRRVFDDVAAEIGRAGPVETRLPFCTTQKGLEAELFTNPARAGHAFETPCEIGMVAESPPAESPS